ncbi:MAG: discoidin domain-containing protein [bacterium]|nr:discoidin domain-containing protein [bacterium]
MRNYKLNILNILFLLTIFSQMYAVPREIIKPYGSEFYLNGTTFRFVGVNIRGLVHYGYGYPLYWPTSGHIDENLDGVKSFGGKVIRIFAPAANTTHQENVNRLKTVLDKMDARGLKAIICLTDGYNTGYCPAGDYSYYSTQPGGWTLLDDVWFAGGFRVNYLPFVKLAVSQLKDHNAIFAWELGNELTDIKNPNNIINFALEVSSTIKSIDTSHMVTTGFIGIDHTQIGETAGYNLYASPYLDFMTQHCYNGEDQTQNWTIHSRLQKPLIIEEFGWETTYGNRTVNTVAQMTKWLDTRGARGFMHWGYQAQSYDIGDGDNRFGIDRYHFTDYSQMVSIYSSRAAQFAAITTTQPKRLTPIGTNIALSCASSQTDSIYGSGWEGYKAYDGVISGSSKWCSNGTPPPHWLALDLGQPRWVSGFTVQMPGAAGEWIIYNFKNFQIQSGTSLNGPWTTEFTVDNSPQFSSVNCLYNTPKQLRFIRIYITNCGIDNYARLPEFEVYETLPTEIKSFWQLFE